MPKFASMPSTVIVYDKEDGSITITQNQDSMGEVAVWFPVQMASAIIDGIKSAAAEADAE